jgi:hypothetical protein
MADLQDISLAQFRTLTERAGLDLSDAELADLKPMYDHYAALIQTLHEMDLGMEDLAVTFVPDWPPESPPDTP